MPTPEPASRAAATPAAASPDPPRKAPPSVPLKPSSPSTPSSSSAPPPPPTRQSTVAPPAVSSPSAPAPAPTSGTATAFDFLRNDALDAKDYFDTVKLPERQNDFGGTLGGYLRIPHLYDGRGKTFFFFSYEGLRLQSPQASTLYEVPSQTLRSSAPTALQPFLDAFPVSTSADLGNGLADYTSGYSAPSRLDTSSVRIDHTLNDRFRLFGRYSDVPSQSTARSSSDLAQVDATTRNVKTLVLGASNVLTNSIANELRFGLTGNDYKSARYLDNFGGATPLNVSSAPGLANGDWMTFFLFYGLYPYYLLEPQSNRQRQINVTDALTETHGRHNFKYGVDYRRLVTLRVPPPALGGRLLLRRGQHPQQRPRRPLRLHPEHQHEGPHPQPIRLRAG